MCGNFSKLKFLRAPRAKLSLSLGTKASYGHHARGNVAEVYDVS